MHVSTSQEQPDPAVPGDPGVRRVELKFTDEALRAIAREALKRNVGAHGLRIILEELMLDLMYNVPRSATSSSA